MTSFRVALGIGLGLVLGFGSKVQADPSALVPPDHWAVQAAERLEQLGLVSDYLPAQRAVPLAELERVLAQGAQNAPDPLRPLTSAWMSRFRAEFRRHPGVVELNAVVSGKGRTHDARLPEAPERTPFGYLRGVPSEQPTFALGAGAVFSSPWVAAMIDADVSPVSLRFNEWEAVAEYEGVSLSVGRRPVAFGFGRGTGVVFSGSVPFDRVELQTSRPFRLPGFLSALGLFAVDGFFATLDEPRHQEPASLFAMTVYWKPLPRLTFSVHRATMFGSNPGSDLSALDVLQMVTLTKNSSENNLISGAFRFVAPTERLIPLTIYGEWGTEDSAGNHLYTPGLMTGLSVPAVPGLPRLSLGGEFAFFGKTTRRNLKWYIHAAQQGGWVSRDLPLGHPMGGNGREWRAWASAMVGDNLLLDATGFRRTRFSNNLYSPTREGVSLGGQAAVSWRFTERTELAVRAGYEAGQAWRELSVDASAAVRF